MRTAVAYVSPAKHQRATPSPEQAWSVSAYIDSRDSKLIYQRTPSFHPGGISASVGPEAQRKRTRVNRGRYGGLSTGGVGDSVEGGVETG